MKKANTAKSKKQKGRVLENWVASRIRHHGGDLKAQAMPGSGAFAHFKGDIHTRLPYSIECKAQETTKVWDWYEQAKRQVTSLETPVVIFKRNYSEPMALLSAEDFLQIICELEEYKKLWHNE